MKNSMIGWLCLGALGGFIGAYVFLSRKQELRPHASLRREHETSLLHDLAAQWPEPDRVCGTNGKAMK